MATTKKTTKVVTPIDERETFVSLRKNFAENEQAAQEKLKMLYELQATDMEIDKLVQLRGELPEEVAELEGELDNQKARYARTEQMIEGYNQSIEENKQQIDELVQETEKYRSQLGNITNSREFDSINKEIENQELLKAIAEKNINEARAAIEDCKADLDRINDAITIRESDLEAKKNELAGIVESTAKEEKTLEERRSTFTSKLDERTISAYERIRNSTHNHLAVVTLFPRNEDGTYGNACGGCFHTITPQRLIDIASGKKLVICEHCGRIIVNPDI
ncbi:MAG TPA: hypothetical protein IAC35_06885 [Candidatus Cryptobacteroides merdipullorum]|uniref:C4-type zinc ribbon domain-containing protein n=1 Tax=Candidatus Cryptobacteroides merdipullorum TaxID=2840771 RepID=A0A9D1GNU0_9BACT|nr:hypothetical protein [Candidatus Cryptobacteroides merdipullorum]